MTGVRFGGKRVYGAADGAQFPASQAQQIGEELEGIGEAPSAREVVATAKRRKKSALHGQFEWDDPTAAQKYRLEQARHILNHIVIQVTTNDGEEKNVRAYHHAEVVVARDDDTGEETKERRYVHVSVVEREPDIAEHTCEQALKELIGWKTRYALYRELFAGVFEEIDAAQSAVEVEGAELAVA